MNEEQNSGPSTQPINLPAEEPKESFPRPPFAPEPVSPPPPPSPLPSSPPPSTPPSFQPLLPPSPPPPPPALKPKPATKPKPAGAAFKKMDILVAIIIGEICAWLVIPIAKNLNLSVSGFDLKMILPWILPLLSAIGILVAWQVAKLIKVIYQFAKFVLVGILNTFIDWGVLNLLIFFTGQAAGVYYIIFKSLSFIVSNANSYFWNRFWVFQKTGSVLGGNGTKSFLQFFLVSAGGFLLNVGSASLIVFLGLKYNWAIEGNYLANLGAFVGTILGLLWNFLGYKLIVFKK